MITFYCSVDGSGPRPCPNWRELASAAYEADSAATVDPEAPITTATDVVNAQRIAEPGHVARNGNPPRTVEGTVPAAVELVGAPDGHGGRLTFPVLLCPECGASVRCMAS